MFCRFFIFFAYIEITYYGPSKNTDFKIQITVKKNFNLKYFMNVLSISELVSNIDYPTMC